MQLNIKGLGLSELFLQMKPIELLTAHISQDRYLLEKRKCRNISTKTSAEVEKFKHFLVEENGKILQKMSEEHGSIKAPNDLRAVQLRTKFAPN